VKAGMMTVRCLLLLLGMVCARTTGTADAPPPAHRAHGNSPAVASRLPDTVSALLFAGFNVRRLTVNGPRGMCMNGGADTARVHTIALAGGALVVDGVKASGCTLAPPASGVLELSTGRKRKRLSGSVTISAGEDRLVIVGYMALRDYLAAALSTEASGSDPMEFLVALSAVQRNYVASHRGRHAPLADLCDVTHCQLADFSGVSPRIQAAVARAMSISLTAGEGLPCYYSAACGGSTLTPAQIWRTAEPGYSGVICRHCRHSLRFRWERTIEATPEIEAIIRQAPSPPFIDDDFKIRLGRVAGFNKALSNTIDRLERRGRRYVIAGRGFGHRVGLCMEGARELARHGRSAVDILRFYFPLARVQVQQ